MTEDEMGFGITDSMDMCLSQLWALVKESQRSLLCCSPYGGKESDTTERLNLCSNKTAAFYWLGESPYSWPSKGLSLEARVFPGGSDSKESA